MKAHHTPAIKRYIHPVNGLMEDYRGENIVLWYVPAAEYQRGPGGACRIPTGFFALQWCSTRPSGNCGNRRRKGGRTSGSKRAASYSRGATAVAEPTATHAP